MDRLCHRRARRRLRAQAVIAAALLVLLPAPTPSARLAVAAVGPSLPPPSVIDPCDRAHGDPDASPGGVSASRGSPAIAG